MIKIQNIYMYIYIFFLFIQVHTSFREHGKCFLRTPGTSRPNGGGEGCRLVRYRAGKVSVPGVRKEHLLRFREEHLPGVRKKPTQGVRKKHIQNIRNIQNI